MKPECKEMKIPEDVFFGSLLDNEFLSDIKYRFPGGKIIFAHTFVLSCRSSEFYKSFQGNHNSSSLHNILDAAYEEFSEFLRFVYTGECEINELNVGALLQLAVKNKLNDLEIKCFDMLLNGMTVGNVSTVLEKSLDADCMIMKFLALDLIAKNYLETLSSATFLRVKFKTLKTILELDAVSDVDEFKIFEQTMKWATESCLSNSLQPSSKSKRTQLGDILKLIRFGAMTTAEFGDCQKLVPGLLTDDEILSIFLSISTGKKNPLGFPGTKRLQLDAGNLDSVSFPTFSHPIWNYSEVNTEFKATFSVSNPITLQHIDVNSKENLQMIRLIEHADDEDVKEADDKDVDDADDQRIYEKLEPFIGSLEINQLLQPSKRYTIHVTYSQPIRMWFTVTGRELKSSSGKCLLTLFPNSQFFINNLILTV